MKFFKGNVAAFSLLAFICLGFSGCVYLIIGGVAAAGGYAVSRDTIQGETDKSFDAVWDKASEVVGIMGTVESESYELGTIDSIVNGARVKITITQLTPSTVQVKVKARI